MLTLRIVGLPLGLLSFSASWPVAPVATTRYRLETKIETALDLSAVGQGVQNSTATQLAIFSITLSDTAGGKVMHVVIDSVASDAPLPDLPALLAKAKGAWLHGYIDATGRARVSATSADSNDFVAELKGRMLTFFPRVSAGATAGTVKVYTTAVDLKSSMRAVKQQVITTYTVGPQEDRGGEKATRIDASFVITGTGTMESPMAGSMQVESNDGGKGTYFITADGRYLGGDAVSEGKTLVRSAMLPDAIPVKTKQTSAITVLK